MSLPKPYYQDDWATIYLGDCREILPELPKVDLVLTDPPYGVSGEQNSKSSSKKNDYLGMIDSIEFVWNVCAPVVALTQTIVP